MPRLLALSLLCWLGLPRLAAAEAMDLDPPVAVGVRALLGTGDVGELSGSTFGVGLSAHVPFERLGVVFELDSLASSPENSDTGDSDRSRHQRFRVLARLPLLELQHKRFRGGLSASAGVGGEWVTFAERDSVRRDFVSWGLDSVNGFRSKRLAGSFISIDYGFRLDIARAPEQKKRQRPPGCTGPCSTATVTEPIDVALTMGLTFSWGPVK